MKILLDNGHGQDTPGIWGLDLQSYQIHARRILLDTKTGYRSQFLQVSGIICLEAG